MVWGHDPAGGDFSVSPSHQTIACSRDAASVGLEHQAQPGHVIGTCPDELVLRVHRHQEEVLRGHLDDHDRRRKAHGALTGFREPSP
jgi:hypothetical protein